MFPAPRHMILRRLIPAFSALGMLIAAAHAQDIVVIDPHAAPAPDVVIPAPTLSPGEEEAAEPTPDDGTPAPRPPAPEEETPLSFNAVRLQGLNKVTARISPIDAPFGAVMRFGNLEVIARRCWQAPPEAQPESAALLEIRELKSGEGPVTVFHGWMFASTPALSALEHPVYDVTVLTCLQMEGLE